MAKATAITESGKKFSELLILTPAVSIDHSYQQNDTVRKSYHTDIQSDEDGSMTNLLPNANPVRRWRWCTLICAAVKCFKNNHANNLNNNVDKSNNDRELSKRSFLHTYDITEKSNRYSNRSDKNSNITYQL